MTQLLGSRDEFYFGCFPDNFIWSTATASYQIEGAWNLDGKGVNSWDTFSREEGRVVNGDTGDIACDSYHKYEDDISMLKQLGVSHYRFSLSWARILPNGTTEKINEKGIDYYNRLINGLLSAGITPVVTIYHWDHPQTLEDAGGWRNARIVDQFNDYARLCFTRFGDRVKFWITLNEPLCSSWNSHATGEHAPGIRDPLCSPFLVSHNLIRSHTKAWHTYDKEFRAKQAGRIGITLNTDWSEPKDWLNAADVEASERLVQMRLGVFANPIFGNGDYPAILKAQLATKAKQLGLKESPLQQFTAEEIRLNRGSSDFFGLNHYSTRIVSGITATTKDDVVVAHPTNQTQTPSPPSVISEAVLMDAHEEVDPSWKTSGSKWLIVVPFGMRRILNWIRDHYGNPVVYITENGVSDNTGILDDQHRVDYYRSYINEVLKAIRIDGCDVRGYTAWSLMDNFEWARGYSERFGLFHVDFTDANRPRKAKASAAAYTAIIRQNGFPKISSSTSIA